MKYVGRYKDINEESYYLEIITNNNNSTTEDIILGTPPFIVNYEGGGNTIYKPIKFSSATITVATDNIYNDMYSGKNQGTSIKLYNSQRTLWVGYITPNVYNQTYSGVVENLEIECVDALSTLKNIDYKTIGESKNIVSIYNVLLQCLQQCNTYNILYISNTISCENGNIVGNLYVSENNFFDEDDEPMKCSEVLEEILKYLNMTMFADGMNVYIVDYDAIASDKYTETYNAYNINDGTFRTTIKQTIKEITPSSFRGSDGDLSIDNVYNKAVVVAEMYDTGNIIEGIFDDDKIEVGEEKTINVYTGDQKNTPSTIDKNIDLHTLHYAFCKHPNVEYHYWGNVPNTGVVESQDGFELTDYSQLPTFNGATIYKYALSENSVGMMEMQQNGYIIPIQSKINYTTCLMFHLNNTFTQVDFEHFHKNRRLINIKPSKTNLIADDNTFLLFKMDATFRDAPQRYYMGDKYKGDLPLKIRQWYAYWNARPFIFFNIFNTNFTKVLHIGENHNNSWNSDKVSNENGNVNKIEPYQLPFYLKNTLVGGDGCYDKENIFDNQLKLFNNVHYSMGINDEGYLVKLPNGTNINDIVISFYQPYLPYYSIDEELHTIFIENIEIKVVSKNEENENTNEENEDTNTTYENVINDDYLIELDEIPFKVNTYDRKITHSAVYKVVNDKTEYVDTLYNKALDQSLRMEEMLIYRIVQQYKEPRKILNFTLSNDFSMCDKITYPSQESNKNFIVDEMQIDYEAQQTQIKLIEKI